MRESVGMPVKVTFTGLLVGGRVGGHHQVFHPDDRLLRRVDRAGDHLRAVGVPGAQDGEEIFQQKDRLAAVFADDQAGVVDGPPLGRAGQVDVVLFRNGDDVVDPGQAAEIQRRVGNFGIVGGAVGQKSRQALERDLAHRRALVKRLGDFGQKGTNRLAHRGDFLFGGRLEGPLGVDRKTADGAAVTPAHERDVVVIPAVVPVVVVIVVIVVVSVIVVVVIAVIVVIVVAVVIVVLSR